MSRPIARFAIRHFATDHSLMHLLTAAQDSIPRIEIKKAS